MRRGQRDQRRGRIWVIGRRRRAATVTYPDRTARFGAKTIAGAGAFRPTDSNGTAYDLTSYDSLVSGSLGSYTPSILNGGLRFTGGGAGAPAGAVLRCTHANGTIDITIGSLIANTYSVATLTEADAASDAAVLGDRIELRAGSHNSTASRVIISRAASPSGTWTGTSALSDGNWVVLTRDPGATVTIGALEIAGVSNSTHPRYLRLDDLDFVSPLTADTNGLMSPTTGQLTLNAGSHVAVTNCRFSHTETVTGLTSGTFRCINSSGDLSSVWIEGNDINGCRHGLIGNFIDSVIRRNTIRRCLSDTMQINKCNNTIFEGNVSTDKTYGYSIHQILGITRGATTTVTLADTTLAAVGEPIAFSGVSGALGDAINGQLQNVVSKTASTVVLQINTSSLPDWDGVAGTLHIAALLHGDHLQFNDNPGAANLQDNVVIRGNVWYRGNPGGLFAGGQGLFAGTATYARDNWLVEGNIYHDVYVNGILLHSVTNSTIRSNTVVRSLGIDGSNGGSEPAIRIVGSSSGNTLLDNIANAYEKIGVTTDTNNATVTLVNNDAVPADATSVANYQAAFTNPNTVANIDYDALTSFVTRTDAGSVFSGPIYPGATPYMDFDNLTYSDPRA